MFAGRDQINLKLEADGKSLLVRVVREEENRANQTSYWNLGARYITELNDDFQVIDQNFTLSTWADIWTVLHTVSGLLRKSDIILEDVIQSEPRLMTRLAIPDGMTASDQEKSVKLRADELHMKDIIEIERKRYTVSSVAKVGPRTLRISTLDKDKNLVEFEVRPFDRIKRLRAGGLVNDDSDTTDLAR